MVAVWHDNIVSTYCFEKTVAGSTFAVDRDHVDYRLYVFCWCPLVQVNSFPVTIQFGKAQVDFRNVEVLAPSNSYVPSSRGLYLLEKDVWTEEMSGQDRQDTRYECNTNKFDERGAA